LELEKPIRYVPWCSVDPFPSPEKLEDEISKFPLYFKGPPPFECTVKAGEILYLYDFLLLLHIASCICVFFFKFSSVV
jgi:hypothetical protein